MSTKIIKCTCKHDVQDVMYGVGNRIANEMRTGQLKCTVCGTVQGSQFSSRPVKVSEEPTKRQKPSSTALKGRGPKAKRDRKWGKK
jgi:hypothetical protein